MAAPTRLVLLSLVVLATSTPATADEDHWYSNARGHHRIVHLGIIVAAGTAYLVSEVVLKPDLAPSACRWCTPTSYDVAIRNAIRWHDPTQAAAISNVTGYVAAPLVAIGLMMRASYDEPGDHLPRWLDDTIPILESGILSGLLNQVVKLSVGEQRPFVRFGAPSRPHQVDDNLSFYSAHTAFSFAIATSAGVVAHERRYPLEPVIWATGYAIAGATGYLRLAGDQHYFTDVMVGALVGSGVGLIVPLELHAHVLADHDVAVVPGANGAAIVGTF